MVLFQHLEKWVLRVLDPANALINAQRQAQWQEILECCAEKPTPHEFHEYFYRYNDTEFDHDTDGTRLYPDDYDEDNDDDDESELEIAVRHMFALMECAAYATQNNGLEFNRIAFLVALDELNTNGLRHVPNEQIDGLKADMASIVLGNSMFSDKRDETKITVGDGRTMGGRELIMASFQDYFDRHGDCGWSSDGSNKTIRKMYDLLATHCFPQRDDASIALPDNIVRTRREIREHFNFATDCELFVMRAKCWNWFTISSGRPLPSFNS